MIARQVTVLPEVAVLLQSDVATGNVTVAVLDMDPDDAGLPNVIGCLP